MPYTLCYLLMYVPLCFLELSLGQYSSNGPLSCWHMASIFKGNKCLTSEYRKRLNRGGEVSRGEVGEGESRWKEKRERLHGFVSSCVGT